MQGGNWKGRWYKADNYSVVDFNDGNSRAYIRISTRQSLPMSDKCGHYLYWEFIIEDLGKGKFKSIKELKGEPCKEGGLDYCPLESTILYAEVGKHNRLSLWLETGEGYLKFRKQRYDQVEGDWVVGYQDEAPYDKTLKRLRNNQWLHRTLPRR